MSIKGLVLAIAGIACVGAAAAGGFVAVRMNHAEQAALEVGAPNPPTVAEPQPVTAPPVVAAAPRPPVASRSTSVAMPRTTKSTPSRSVAATPVAPAEMTPPNHLSRHMTPTARPAPTPEGPGSDAPPSTTAAQTTPATSPPPAPPASPATAPPTPPASDAAPPPEAPPPAPILENLTVTKDSVIGITLDAPISSATAKVEDAVTARVARDVTVDGRVAIAAGAKLEGVVASVEHGGRFQTASRIGIKFTALVLADNSRIAIQTETIFRSGEPPANQAASKIGATAVIGGILGALLGGHRGAAIGTAAGAAGGTAAVAAGDVDNAVFPAGAPLTVRLTAPVVITIQLDPDR